MMTVMMIAITRMVLSGRDDNHTNYSPINIIKTTTDVSLCFILSLSNMAGVSLQDRGW